MRMQRVQAKQLHSVPLFRQQLQSRPSHAASLGDSVFAAVSRTHACSLFVAVRIECITLFETLLINLKFALACCVLSSNVNDAG